VDFDDLINNNKLLLMERLKELNLLARVCKELSNFLGTSGESCKDMGEFVLGLWRENPSQIAFSKALRETELPEALISSLYKTIAALTAPINNSSSSLTTTGGSAAAGGRGGDNNNKKSAFNASLAIIDSEPVPLEKFRGGATGLTTFDDVEEKRSGVGKDDDPRAPSLSSSTITSPSLYWGGSSANADASSSSSSSSSFSSSSSSSSSSTLTKTGGAGDAWAAHSKAIEAEGPQLYAIYDGRVNQIKDFGCFVELIGLKPGGGYGRDGKVEGLVHISAISTTRISSPNEAVSRGQNVKVKVISLSGGKVSLSIKDVDQSTGADLMPNRQAPALDMARARSDVSGAAGARSWGSNLTGVKIADEDSVGGVYKRQRRATSQERFERKQLIASGVLDASALDDEEDEEDGASLGGDMSLSRGKGGVLGAGGGGGRSLLKLADDLDEAEFEIEIKEEEPPFLFGQTRMARERSPVRLVANPDGTMQRAALTQGAITKERRELKEQQKQQLLDSIPKDLERAWADPLAAPGDRHLAAEIRSLGMGLSSVQAMPEWKAKQQSTAISYGQRSTLSMKEQRERLPIFSKRGDLLSLFGDNQVVVIIGDTGSGKSTQMTQYLHEAGYTKKGIVGCTQPRRVAAMSVAKRVAEEVGVRLGEEVGYSIRFDDMTSPSTVIKFMTDGMLMREYLMDNNLSRYSVLILDEAHERTIATDILFGLLKRLLKKRPDFKLIVTSATLVKEKFQKYFFDCPSYTIPGRTFPVETHYLKEPESDYLDAAVICVMQIHIREPPGDILLFLTGQEEIDNACETLYARMQGLDARVPELIILPVYSAQTSEMQSKIFDPAPPGKRKCIVATNIAEASLTIDGIQYVVDPGFSKQKVFNPKTGMDSLVVVPISQASAQQRAGRAGRTGPGVCYRLYTEAAFKTEMLPTSIPEIQRANLANVVLQMKAMGINDLMHFDFMDPPSPETLVTALKQLYELGALDDEGLLTRLGRKMAEFPLEPQLSKVLLASVDLGCSEEVLTIVAMLTVENVFYRPKDKQTQADQKKTKFAQSEGDHITFLTVYNGWAAAKFSNAWCFENYIQARAMKRAQDVRKQLVSIMDRYQLDIVSCGRNYKRVQKAIGSGFFMNVAKKDAQDGYKTMEDGQPVYIHPSSTLFQQAPEMVLYHELVLTTKEYMRNVMVIDPKWLIEVAPRHFKQAEQGKMTKAKKRMKIEPLQDKYNPPDSWRLSYRRG